MYYYLFPFLIPSIELVIIKVICHNESDQDQDRLLYTTDKVVGAANFYNFKN